MQHACLGLLWDASYARKGAHAGQAAQTCYMHVGTARHVDLAMPESLASIGAAV